MTANSKPDQGKRGPNGGVIDIDDPGEVMPSLGYFERWKRGEGAVALLKDADRTVEHLKGELKKAVEDGHTMYQRGVNVGRQGSAGGRQP